jgi:two-component system, OmpR family, sensor histidine kinase VicK
MQEMINQEVLLNKLRLAEERSAILTAIVDSSDDAIIGKDLNGFITTWNRAAERIFGYTASEMIGVSITKLIPADRAGEEAHILPRIRRDERVEHFETQRLNKQGLLVDVSLTISPIKDASGNIIGISKIARDITAMKQNSEKSLILSAIVDSTDDAIISKNLDSIVTSWNRSAERLFGYTAEEMIGQSIVMLIPEDRLQEEPAIITKLKSGQRVDHFETKRKTKYGKLLDVSLTISPVMDISGRIIGISKIARDITDKKQEEQRKNDFIAIVSHELKTPLTSMRSYVQLARAKAVERSDAFTENVLDRAENQTKKMTALIQDFLNLSRLEEGKMSLNVSDFSLTELMEEVLSDMLTLSSTHTIICEPCQKVIISGDREKLGQVLTNLVGNAIKYSPEGTTITMQYKFNNGKIEFSVTDQGYGISEADQSRLFERFYRVNDGRQGRITGFGIGLYLVSEILKLHGGKIKVKSKPGAGSTFSFSLPVQTSGKQDHLGPISI